MAVCFLVFYLLTAGFVQKWHIPKGVQGAVGRVFVTDYDRDGNQEVVFTPYYPIYGLFFCELHLPNTWQIDSFPYVSYPILMDIGDFDLDGLPNLVLQEDFGDFPNGPPIPGISIAEPPDSFSYPTQEVWRDTVGFPLVTPICVYDIDQDGLPEIIKIIGDTTDFDIYESIGDNLYTKIYRDTMPNNGDCPSSTIAFGDFDNDGKMEFVMGGMSAGLLGATYWIHESPMNNVYERTIEDYVPTKNIKDCFTVPDADGDGKLEFVVKGFIVPPTSLIHCFIFEATGNNTYQIIKSFTFSGGYDWYGGGYSDVGDIDGDSIPEICLEGCQNIFIIKSSGNNSFYLWQTLPGNNTGSSVRVFDIDGNGLSEIIISGNNYTRIYEKTPFVTWFCPEPFDTFYANDTVYPKWRLDETIALDSLRLYWSHPQLGCHLIYQGLPTDTICQWVVPDTQSHMSNRFWLVTKGFGRYDSTYSPVFYIKRAPGIEEFAIPHSAFRVPHLDVSPNPFTEKTEIRFTIHDSRYRIPDINLKIYDVSGRMVKSFNLESCIKYHESAIFWDGTDDLGHKLPPGIYFVYLRNGSLSAIKKVIKLGG